MSYLLIQANARRIPLKDKSVHCVITSPPYWGLRDYKVQGQLGLEPSPDEYVAHMVEVFREVWRVLRDDGTLWLNIGDSYAGSGKGGGGSYSSDGMTHSAGTPYCKPKGILPKNVCGIPWRLAFALQADGWYLRSDIIWAKQNPMPESVQDRPTKSHEYLFLLAKTERYFYDADAVRGPPLSQDPRVRRSSESVANGPMRNSDPESFGLTRGKVNQPCCHPAGRNLRSVLTIATNPYKGAHFAVMPSKLAATCIKAGTSRKGCCPRCGAPWRRRTKKHRVATRPGTGSKVHGESAATVGNRDPLRHTTETRTVGWEPTCHCNAGLPVPSIVFDPFGGAGTSVLVALALGRHGIATELSPEYLGMARRRIERPHAPIRPNGTRSDDLPLFAGLENDI